MKNCSDLFLLTAIACNLSQCLEEKELALLSANLVTLGDLLASMLARKDLCSRQASFSENHLNSAKK